MIDILPTLKGWGIHCEDLDETGWDAVLDSTPSHLVFLYAKGRFFSLIIPQSNYNLPPSFWERIIMKYDADGNPITDDSDDSDGNSNANPTSGGTSDESQQSGNDGGGNTDDDESQAGGGNDSPDGEGEEDNVAKLAELHKANSALGRERKSVEDENTELKAENERLRNGGDRNTEEGSGGGGDMIYYDELSSDADTARQQLDHNQRIQREGFAHLVQVINSQNEKIEALTGSMQASSSEKTQDKQISELTARGVDPIAAKQILASLESDDFDERLLAMDAYRDAMSGSTYRDEQRKDQLEKQTRVGGQSTGPKVTEKALEGKSWEDKLKAVGEVHNSQGADAADALLRSI